MSFRRVSTADVLSALKQKTLERTGQDGMGEAARDGEKWEVGRVGEAVDMSYIDIPTVPFWLMNFHFRGQSMSVTATLVLWPKTAYCRL